MKSRSERRSCEGPIADDTPSGEVFTWENGVKIDAERGETRNSVGPRSTKED